MIRLFIDLLPKSDTPLNRLETGSEEGVAFILLDIASVDEYCLCGEKTTSLVIQEGSYQNLA